MSKLIEFDESTRALIYDPQNVIIKSESVFKKTSNELENISYNRYITFRRLQELIRSGLIDTFNIVKDPNWFISIMNVLHTYDLSLAIKTGVNFGLFGAGLLRLGDDSQVNHVIADLNCGKIFGSLAITEVGHGSNLKGLETLATWNPDVNCFILDSPTETSVKCWIGNAAMHATHAIVFAQLYYPKENSEGNECKGIHPFLVRLRLDGSLAPGVTIMDNGPKKGLNGVDNGMIRFSSVYLERTSLLSKFGFVDEFGRYVCPYSKESIRFSELLSTLSGGRGVFEICGVS